MKLAQLVTIDLNSDMVLVRREVADAQLAKQAQLTAPLGTTRARLALGNRPFPGSRRAEELSPRARGPAASTPRSP